MIGLDKIIKNAAIGGIVIATLSGCESMPEANETGNYQTTQQYNPRTQQPIHRWPSRSTYAGQGELVKYRQHAEEKPAVSKDTYEAYRKKYAKSKKDKSGCGGCPPKPASNVKSVNARRIVIKH